MKRGTIILIVIGVLLLIGLIIGLTIWATKPKQSNNFPIDGVWTWVDGTDPEWQRRQKKAFEGDKTNAQGHLPISQKVDKDELYYSLGFSAFTLPWLRRRIVVCPRGHVPKVPSWVKVDIVHDDEISTNPEETFNSECILGNLDRIPNLSEHFIAINDDIFVVRPMTPQEFFKDGKPIWFRVGQLRHPPGSVYESALQTSADWTGVNRDRMVGAPHIPIPLTRTLFKTLRKRVKPFENICTLFPIRALGCPSVPHLFGNGTPDLIEWSPNLYPSVYLEDSLPLTEKHFYSKVICINNLGPKTPSHILSHIFSLLENHLSDAKASSGVQRADHE